jgi:hypothetical protein
LTPERLHVMEKVAGKAASRYLRVIRVVAREDLEQTAWAAMLGATQNFDPTLGVPFGAYCWMVAIRALSSEVLRASAPVSASDHHLKELRYLFGAPVHDDVRPSSTLAPDAALEHAQRNRAIRDRTRALLGRRGSLFAFALLEGRAHPRDFAREHGLSVGEMYRLTATVRSRLRDDVELHRLWTNR